jgi:hypothetical protein
MPEACWLPITRFSAVLLQCITFQDLGVWGLWIYSNDILVYIRSCSLHVDEDKMLTQRCQSHQDISIDMGIFEVVCTVILGGL